MVIHNLLSKNSNSDCADCSAKSSTSEQAELSFHSSLIGELSPVKAQTGFCISEPHFFHMYKLENNTCAIYCPGMTWKATEVIDEKMLRKLMAP